MKRSLSGGGPPKKMAKASYEAEQSEATPFKIDFVKKQNQALAQEMYKFKRQTSAMQVGVPVILIAMPYAVVQP